MSNILLAKPKLPGGWLNVSVGEPYIVREKLFETFDMSDWKLPIVDHAWDYPPPNGFKPLVDLLEWKHNAPVVVTNGAKQALSAVFWALKKVGWNYCGEKSPHWALIPPLAKVHDIDMVHANGPHVDDKSPFLLISPNNPNGHLESPDELNKLSKEFKEANLPLIHDAAYHTHAYIPQGTPLPPIGDVQIYSVSKMLGLSSLRVGYAVCPNPEFYRLIKEYMEAMTVGVSLPSQIFTYELMNRMRGYPTLTEKFENNSFLALQESKNILKTVDPEVLEVPTNLEETPGMFGWFKTGPKFSQEKAKVNFIDGALFGAPGFVRMNLSLDKEKIQEIVNRLNDSKE